MTSSTASFARFMSLFPSQTLSLDKKWGSGEDLMDSSRTRGWQNGFGSMLREKPASPLSSFFDPQLTLFCSLIFFEIVLLLYIAIYMIYLPNRRKSHFKPFDCNGSAPFCLGSHRDLHLLTLTSLVSITRDCHSPYVTKYNDAFFIFST